MLHPEGAHGPDGLTELITGYRATLSGLNVTIEHQFTEGDYVATRGTVRGRHDGELMGAAATGRDVEFTVLTISRCRDGKIEAEWELIASCNRSTGCQPPQPNPKTRRSST